jgi:imidazolonepropionase-like amidohydrolase
MSLSKCRIGVLAAWILAAVAWGAGGQATAQDAPERVALTGARIIPITGPEIAKGTILIEHGKITAVGEDLEIPFDARVFDLPGMVITPGLIDVHSSEGMDSANESRPVTPQLDVYDAIDPSRLYFEDALRLGTTAIHIIPGNNTVVGGVGRVVRPIGLTLGEMTIAEGAFLKIAVTPRRGADRMLQIAMLREVFAKQADDLEKLAEQRYEEDREKKEKPVDVLPAEAAKRGVALIRAEDLTDETRNLLRLTGGRVEVGETQGAALLSPLGAFVYCQDAMDVGPAIRIAKEHGFFDRLVLVLGGESFKAIAELKQAARPVVLPEDLVYREQDPITGEMSETFVPKVIADAGLQYSIVPGPSNSLPERMLTYQAARCVRDGISRDDALRAITISPARTLGLEDRLGSIEPGKDAHLVVFSGDPLDFNSVVERVFIDGVPAYHRATDIRIQRLLDSSGQPEDDHPE